MFRKDLESLRKQDVNSEAEAVSSQSFPTVEPSLLQKHNIEPSHFKSVFERLLFNWWNSSTSIQDCEGKRFIQATLFKNLNNPLILFIIADDVGSFRKSYNGNHGETLFDLCCVCGSDKIVNEFFLSGNQGNQYLLKSENALAYALSSGNKEFVLGLAKQAAILGRKDPGPLALYSMNNLFYSKEIADIFSSSKLNHEANRMPNEASASPSFTPQLGMKQSPSGSNDVGFQKATELLSLSDFSQFLQQADSQQFKLFFDALTKYRETFQNGQKPTIKNSPSSSGDV